MKHCNACGFDNEDTAKFCTNCGKLLPTVAPIPPEGHPHPQNTPGGSVPPNGSFDAGNASRGNGNPDRSAPQAGGNPNTYGQGPNVQRHDPQGQPAYTDRRSYSPRIRPLYLILMLPFFFLFLIFLIGTFMDWTGFPFLFLFGIPSYMFFKFATTPRESETITIKTNIPRQYRKGNFILVCITLTIVLTFVGIAIVPM